MRDDIRAEILRQCDRMGADFLSREVAVALTCAMFAFILPWPVVIGVWLVCILSEGSEALCYRAIAKGGSRGWQAAYLVNSIVAFSAFSLLGVLAWDTGETMLRFIALLTLVGALVNVSTARSIHLPFGLASGLPPALALTWIATESLRAGDNTTHGALASVATVILLGYFVAALSQNHRMHSDLIAESARARDASAAKSRFISEMSHEMRTPLNAIGGLAATLRDAADGGTRDAAHRIEAASRDLAGMVDEVFDLAAAAEGQLRARTMAVDVRGEARLISAMLATPGDNPANRPLVSVAPDVPPALAYDPLLAQKILRLVVAEAPHRTKTACLPERIALALAEGGEALSITIRFRRGVAGAGPPPRTGTGQSLGSELLAILTSLAKAQVDWSGFDTAHPQAVVTLPVMKADLVPGTTLNDAAGPAIPTGTPTPSLAALVVDDIATNRFILVQMLRKLGITATEVDSGSAALAALGTGTFDLVLLDMNMPGMDGAETFRGIRALNGTVRTGASNLGLPAIPVIALTADGLGNRERLLALGLDGYVAKPIEHLRLKAEIEAVLSPRHPTTNGGGTGVSALHAPEDRVSVVTATVSSDYPSARPDVPAP